MSGSDDGSFFIWEKETTNLVRILQGDESIVNCLQPHPSYCFLATSGIDPVVRLWNPRPEVRLSRIPKVEIHNLIFFSKPYFLDLAWLLLKCLHLHISFYLKNPYFALNYVLRINHQGHHIVLPLAVAALYPCHAMFNLNSLLYVSLLSGAVCQIIISRKLVMTVQTLRTYLWQKKNLIPKILCLRVVLTSVPSQSGRMGAWWRTWTERLRPTSGAWTPTPWRWCCWTWATASRAWVAAGQRAPTRRTAPRARCSAGPARISTTRGSPAAATACRTARVSTNNRAKTRHNKNPHLYPQPARHTPPSHGQRNEGGALSQTRRPATRRHLRSGFLSLANVLIPTPYVCARVLCVKNKQKCKANSNSEAATAPV